MPFHLQLSEILSSKCLRKCVTTNMFQVFRPALRERSICMLIMSVGILGTVIGTTFALKDIVCALSGSPVGGGWPCQPPPEHWSLFIVQDRLFCVLFTNGLDSWFSEIWSLVSRVEKEGFYNMLLVGIFDVFLTWWNINYFWWCFLYSDFSRSCLLDINNFCTFLVFQTIIYDFIIRMRSVK